MKLRETLETLFKEIFEGTAPGADSTWVVQGGEALEDTLSRLSAEQASVQATPNSSSIAAHVIHMTYYLQLSNREARGQAVEYNWAGSWKQQTVTEDEWVLVLKSL